MHATVPDAGSAPHDPADSRDGVLVLCLGNDLLRDDGVGWAIADELERRLSAGCHYGVELPPCFAV